jgi:hypothetical protein
MDGGMSMPGANFVQHNDDCGCFLCQKRREARANEAKRDAGKTFDQFEKREVDGVIIRGIET